MSTPEPAIVARSFPELLDLLWTSKHTGPVIVHFAGGKPQAIEIQQPGQRIVLDNRAA